MIVKLTDDTRSRLIYILNWHMEQGLKVNKSRLAHTLGVARPTLDAWIKEVESDILKK